MTRPKFVKVQQPLPGAGLVSFGAGRSVKSRQTEFDEKYHPSLVRFDIGMHARRNGHLSPGGPVSMAGSSPDWSRLEDERKLCD